MNTTLRIALLWSFVCLLGTQSFAQSTKNDIPVAKLPADVKNLLIEYVSTLRSSSDLDNCAENFLALAGGSLVNEDASALRSDIKPYSLKKDFDNVRFYADPIKITRVNVSTTNGTGYGASALKGKIYKVWIAKKDDSAGLPAPISIIVPEGHASITTPKVVGIGSL